MAGKAMKYTEIGRFVIPLPQIRLPNNTRDGSSTGILPLFGMPKWRFTST
jgi:hypothetical protein